MPIIAGDTAALQSAISSAFERSRQDGSADGADSNAVISQLSSDIAAAVEAYVSTVTVKILPGIVVTTDPATGVGSTTGEGSS